MASWTTPQPRASRLAPPLYPPPPLPASSHAHARPQHQDLVARIHNNALLTPTALVGRLDISGSTANAESSTSDSDSQTPSSAHISPRHSRSMSNPFPSFFTGKKRRPDATPRGPPLAETDSQHGSMAAHSPRKQRRGVSAANKDHDFTTGNCMACASLVKWPHELTVFKCTICCTINDLVPSDRDSCRRRSNQESARYNHRGQPISTLHSKRLIRQCLYSHLTKKLCASPIPTPEPRHTSLTQSSHDKAPPLSRPCLVSGDQDAPQATHGQTSQDAKLVLGQEQTRHLSASHQSNSVSRLYSSLYPGKPPTQPVTAGLHSRSSLSQSRDTCAAMSRKDAIKSVFRPLADYIVTCFSSFDSVNNSFLSHSPRRMGGQCGDLSIPRKPVPSREPLAHRQAPESSHHGPRMDSLASVLDPKMLLVGDIAENGLWWTGGQHEITPPPLPQPARSESSGKASVSSKSPNINWLDLTDWYTTVMNAAQGWFEIYEEISSHVQSVPLDEPSLQALERELLEAQAHVQRVLLKATETLLKRPGRPLTSPVELRFLIILLENPLLHPSPAIFQGLIQPETPTKTAPRVNLTSGPRTGLLSGQHSGIIKRIIGLLSNSSIECHSSITNWLARYQKSRFIRTKELVSSFLTYRLLRQSDRSRPGQVDITAGLIPEMQIGRSAGAYLHDEIGSSKKQKEFAKKTVAYAEDWQTKAAARVLALLFSANNAPIVRHSDEGASLPIDIQVAAVRDGVHASGQLLPTSDFYNLMIDNVDLVSDFESWESRRSKFSFCQYPFLLSIWAKSKILEYDARRQMQNKARDAFFDSIMTRRNIKQHLALDVRRECLVDDSLKAVSEVIGSGSEDVKKALRITFRGEEGIDGGGLRKEWFLLLVREVFNPDHGMFLYDEDSRYCYFNPNSFETSDQFFLVGVVMGLAIYNTTILDVALPPFTFRKILSAAPVYGHGISAHPRPPMKYSLEDLAEYKPRLARGLKQLLDYEGDVQEAFCLDFVIDVDRYGTNVQVPLCNGGQQKPVTNGNRREYVDLYIRFVLDTAVTRQFEPFKRGFYTVCGGNAFSLFRPEEIELLVRGSDEGLDIPALRAVAEYDGWGNQKPDGIEPVVGWFWDSFEQASAADQRKMLLFITGSDRIPAMGAVMLSIKISCLGDDCGRYPIARTCFNQLSLWRYESRERLESMVWTAVHGSEGFGLK
ncbi:hypothetical protein CDD82_4341 [Ophiocordyceps australis]|uniref:HECT-type E3 ubiquitin transferase n=1 Tax=Ophiocordyceps australis TaxID=1399860 RepID=A0A2C5ZPA7_9HYPO|nr:hypothetical protein CDD82_4341 [Ophiocordyceps australis]